MSAIENTEDQIPLYPIRFEPIFQYRIWGGRQLAELFTAPLPDNEPIGEAWVLSDRDDHASLVANGALKGLTIGQLMQDFPKQMMGNLAEKFKRSPLLLKFLDAHKMLSVQVHPSDKQMAFIPDGESGKTEAWVVLKSGSESRIYAGLKPETTAKNLRQSLDDGNIEDHLSYFTPKSGDAVFLSAGTVHALGGDVLAFEVQQNSDVTYRLYDWNHIDAKTAKPRPLQIDEAIASIDFTQGEKAALIPVSDEQQTVLRELLVKCEYFQLWRLSGKLPFAVGLKDAPRIVVCINGDGELEHENMSYPIRKGDVWLLPAVVGACMFHPNATVSLLEIALPE